MFDDIIENYRNDIISTTSELIKFPSVSEETDSKENPFGENCTNALNYILDLAEYLGFRTKNIDNYCGYIEFGEGEELVGIIGHLDVVPALEEDGWTTPPFSPTIRDEKLFGRGSIDDKGPVVASLYAMKAIMDNTKVSKTVRLILGLNEEKGWKCIDYYKEHEKWPDIGFSPDANFPGIYAEKGILSLELSHPLKINNFEIIEIDCKQNAINVVPKYCAITLKNLTNLVLPESENIKITNLENQIIKIESFGVAAHAAHPELGQNAIENLVKYLVRHFSFDNNILKTLYNNDFFAITTPEFMLDQIEDESGILTSNVANFEHENGIIKFKLNLRVPVTFSLDEIFNKYNSFKSSYPNLETKVLSTQDSLYIEKDSYLVKTLVNIFNKKAGIIASPISIGGGTYARAFKNCISYGLTMPGDKDMCHQVDEYVEIENLILGSKIYAEAIYELAK